MTSVSAHINKRAGRLLAYLCGIALTGAATVASELIRPHISPPNLVMLYLLAVVMAALTLGLYPAILTAASGVLAFDYFFVPPRFSFTVADKEYLITFLGLFTVGLIISSLVAKLRRRADDLAAREAETTSLYRLSRDLASAPNRAAIHAAVIQNAELSLASEAAIFHVSGQTALPLACSINMEFSARELETVVWSSASNRQGRSNDDAVHGTNLLSVPLTQFGQPVGVLVLRGEDVENCSRRHLEGFAAQTASALERIRLSSQAEQAQVLQAREALERALLNSISHDLRSPLATVTGVLSSLLESDSHLDELSRRELLETAAGEAERLNRFVGNLLDMTRIEAGAVRLNRELCDVQELIGCAMAALESRLGSREVIINLPQAMPLVSMDPVLMTQVLVNLLDNSLKYTPANEPIDLTAATEDTWLVIGVADRGKGVPEQELHHIFDKFYRIPIPEGAGGTGLGLAICKGLVEAHCGRIIAENRAGGGLLISIRLPLTVEEGRCNVG